MVECRLRLCCPWGGTKVPGSGLVLGPAWSWAPLGSWSVVPGPGPWSWSWSLVPGPWSLVLIPGPWSWSWQPVPGSLVPGAWSLVLGPGPWSWSLVLVPGPWSLSPSPWSFALVPGPGRWSQGHGTRTRDSSSHSNLLPRRSEMASKVTKELMNNHKNPRQNGAKSDQNPIKIQSDW